MALLEVKDITMKFGGIVALQNVSLSLEEGETVGLIGPNGSGKTTLFRVIGGGLAPTSGHVIFAREEITGMKPHVLRRRGIARTFQLPSPFPELSLLQHVLIGSHFGGRKVSADEAEGMARDALALVGLSDKMHQHAGVLSMGEMKLLEAAMSLTPPPSLLLLDEPMAGLSPERASRFGEILGPCKTRGITIFLIDHHLKLIGGIVDRLIALDSGRIIAEGSPDILRHHPEIETAYLGEE